MKIGSFHSKEFSQMMFDPSKLSDGEDVLKFYKELGRHKDFRLNAGDGIDNNKLMLYIILVYDKNSPYRKKFSDVLKRKVEVAHDVGFKTMEDGNFESLVEDFLRGNNRTVNRKIVEYVRMHRNFKYSYLVTIESSYYNLMLDILGGETKKIITAKEVQGELEDTLLEILNQDNNPFLKNEILRYIEDERLKLRPEDIALKLQNGEPPI